MRTFIVKLYILVVTCAIFFSCGEESTQPTEGIWRAELKVQDNKTLPFVFEWKKGDSIWIHNAEERILITDVVIKGDSIVIQHPVFEGVFKGIVNKEVIRGSFIKPSLDRVVPFTMIYGDDERFKFTKPATTDISGNWEMVFSAHSEEDRYIAKGIFEQKGDIVTGTIRTTTGDYRYLEGAMDGNVMKLSTFDGAHAFLFEGQVKDSLLYGFFYSGNHWKEPFSAIKNEAYELPDENKLTFIKEGYEGF